MSVVILVKDMSKKDKCVKIQDCSDNSKAFNNLDNTEVTYDCNCSDNNKCAEGFTCINNRCIKTLKCSNSNDDHFKCKCDSQDNTCPPSHYCSNSGNYDLEKYKLWTKSNNYDSSNNCICKKNNNICSVSKNNCGNCYDSVCVENEFAGKCECRCIYNYKKCMSFDEWLKK